MNREILFRAKSKNSGRWVYGDLITQKYKSRQGVHIYEKNESFGYQFVRVNKKTIGQYTGCNDINGNKIFEGDILRVIPKEKSPDGKDHYDYVIYSDGCFCLANAIMFSEFTYGVDSYEIVGNIYDNPEFLGERVYE